MSVLKTCPYCGGHGYINQFEDVDGGCRAWANECIACKGTGTILAPETNADRIRRMSDEELSEWLCQALDCDFCKAYLQNMSIYSCCENQVKGIFDWLQSLAEEDT